ncbi:MAG TPA: YkgJ family cysteine cluster protein [Kofleriaceae bacterium]|nr:YkgJ family cysteine cluster protein [Kofleriaceae bacterium]
MTTRLPIYRAADDEIDAFQRATGLACPTGCGVCCETQTPYVRVADMQEIAEAHVARGVEYAEATLARARAAGAERPCAIYEPGRLPGGCTEYELRPILCRLFGFGAVRDKQGAAALAACRVHKQVTPELAARAIDFVANGGAVPMIADWQATADAAIADRDPQLLPINVALAEALERSLLRAQYANASEAEHLDR